MFSKNRVDDRHARLAEEQVYEMVLAELADGNRRPGIWAKAMADSDGSDDRARSIYIKYRAQSILDEMSLAQDERQRAIEQQTREENQRRANAITVADNQRREKNVQSAKSAFNKLFFGLIGIALVLMSLTCFIGVWSLLADTLDGDGVLVGFVGVIGALFLWGAAGCFKRTN